MGLSFDDLEGQTPLDEDEKLGLLIPTIATRGELDEFEQQNIEDAIQWSLTENLNRNKSYLKHLFWHSIKECIRTYGDGLVNTEKQIRILGLIN